MNLRPRARPRPRMASGVRPGQLEGKPRVRPKRGDASAYLLTVFRFPPFPLACQSLRVGASPSHYDQPSVSIFSSTWLESSRAVAGGRAGFVWVIDAGVVGRTRGGGWEQAG